MERAVSESGAIRVTVTPPALTEDSGGTIEIRRDQDGVLLATIGVDRVTGMPHIPVRPDPAKVAALAQAIMEGHLYTVVDYLDPDTGDPFKVITHDDIPHIASELRRRMIAPGYLSAGRRRRSDEALLAEANELLWRMVDADGCEADYAGRCQHGPFPIAECPHQRAAALLREQDIDPGASEYPA